MLKEEWLEVRAMKQLVEGLEKEIVKKIKEARDKDEEVIKAVEKWQIEERRVYVLKDEKLRVEIIWLHHNTPVAEHGGQWKTVELVTRNYWWPGVIKEVKQYVEGCDQCQRIKNRIEMPAGKLRPNEVWERLSLVVILKLNSVSEVQYKGMMTDR